MIERHRILIAEDKPESAAVIAEHVSAIDCDYLVVSTLEELQARYDEYDPCGIVNDIQMPTRAGARPNENAGMSGIKFARRRSSGPTRVAIVVLTEYRNDPDFVWEMTELQADQFCEKANIDALGGKLLACLKKNGREDHASCARCSAQSRPSQSTPAPPRDGATLSGDARLRLVVDGRQKRGRTLVVVNAIECPLQDKNFIVLLRIMLEHRRAPGEWRHKSDLGSRADRIWEPPSRINGDVAERLDREDAALIDSDVRGSFRLHEDVVIERIDFRALARHSDETVRKLARELQKVEPAT